MKRNVLSHPTGPTMKIGDKTVSVVVAKYDYRCAVCLSKLDYRGSGVACAKDKSHRGFVHRNEGGKQAEQISINLAEIEEKIWKTH